jgi:hypothetical protein
VYEASLEMALCVAFKVTRVLFATPVLATVKVPVLLPSGMTTPATNDSDLLDPLRATFTPPAGAGPVSVMVAVNGVVPATDADDIERD